MEMSAGIASYRPGEKVPVTYIRNGKENTVTVTLKRTASKIEISSAKIIGDRLGVELENLDSKKAAEYDIEGGVVVKKIKQGGPLSNTRMDPGFIITSVNGTDIKNIDELGQILAGGYDQLQLEGIYPGYKGVYTYKINLDEE